MSDVHPPPVIRVTVFEDGTFQVTCTPQYHGDVGRALGIIASAIEGGADYLVQVADLT